MFVYFANHIDIFMKKHVEVKCKFYYAANKLFLYYKLPSYYRLYCLGSIHNNLDNSKNFDST